MADFNNPVYPAPAVADLAPQYVRAILPVGAGTTVNIYTVTRGQGRFFVTSIVVHDPQPAVAGATGSVTLTFGSASTNGTALCGPLPLANLNGSTANQFSQINPGLALFTGATTANTAAFAFAGGDVLTAFVATATAQNTATTSTVLVDILGYYL